VTGSAEGAPMTEYARRAMARRAVWNCIVLCVDGKRVSVMLSQKKDHDEPWCADLIDAVTTC
jgi:hypothetical protein